MSICMYRCVAHMLPLVQINCNKSFKSIEAIDIHTVSLLVFVTCLQKDSTYSKLDMSAHLHVSGVNLNQVHQLIEYIRSMSTCLMHVNNHPTCLKPAEYFIVIEMNHKWCKQYILGHCMMAVVYKCCATLTKGVSRDCFNLPLC